MNIESKQFNHWLCFLQS